MPRTALLLLALLPLAAIAQPDDPLRTPECRKAVAAVEAEEAAAVLRDPKPQRGEPAASAPVPSPRLLSLRRAAARACLGTHADVLPAPQRPMLLPPSALQAPAIPPPASATRLPPVPPITLPRPAERPQFVTSCDAGGCWASDGTRLQRAGPNLIGPRGFCTQQGALLNCP